MSTLDLLIGSSTGQHVVVIGTLVLYGYLAVRRPDTAREAAERGAKTLVGLATLVLAALLLASAIGELLPREAVAGLVGHAAGASGIVLAGLIGGVLPGGPYAVYPIIAEVANSGAGLAAVLALLVGYGGIGLLRVPYGLVFFETRIVAARVAIGLGVTLAFAAIAAVVIGA
ncbi:hypotheical conserved protein [Halarchaeum acidiphilum MH1-52-1]|uniref:Hypotheical conserved protein n=1 Tax=Halarchaeum acidiphilum MH1-52-1 TaxID=1261545 RepID=U3A718_9EURY|nr:hypothetical protein [Halarchaeum acidiphilum]GAD53454.1 hypotheical conserved protein [Halarchaeum acidiphilum MH1-52-1]